MESYSLLLLRFTMCFSRSASAMPAVHAAAPDVVPGGNVCRGAVRDGADGPDRSRRPKQAHAVPRISQLVVVKIFVVKIKP